MALEIKQSLRMSQQLVVTPQLQQAIKLLQLSRMELTNMIQKELVENPCLEEEDEESETVRLEAANGDGEGPSHGETHEQAKLADHGHEHANEEVGSGGTTADPPKEPSDFDWENYLGQQYDSPSGAYERNLDNDDRPPIESYLKAQESLQDHLCWQLKLANFTAEEIAIGEEIIGNINDDGYLISTTAEIAKNTGSPEPAVEAMLKKIQAFDPIGVAARDLRECLLLQARQFIQEDRPLILTILENHLENLEHHHYKQIAKEMKIPLEKVMELEKTIHQLDPKPGRAFNPEEPQYITPDVFVGKRGENYIISLNEDGLPKLAVSPLYRRAMMGGSTVGTQTKEYIQEKMRQALWLIKSIHQRQQTLYKVTESIVKFQREFFEKGIAQLKPMILKDVAEDIGMHESTISRVTTNKYMHTPRGIFELKYFFNTSIGAQGGGDGVASEVVKDFIQKICAQETPNKPLSDQDITRLLKEKHDIDIARRTVAKYRETLGILSSSRRRTER